MLGTSPWRKGRSWISVIADLSAVAERVERIKPGRPKKGV
jgi:hypothetical protein